MKNKWLKVRPLQLPAVPCGEKHHGTALLHGSTLSITHGWQRDNGKDEGFPLYACPQRQRVALHTWIREHGPAAVLAGEVQLISPELRDALSWPSVRPSSDSPSSQIQRLILFRFAERFAGLSQNATWPQKEKNDIHTYTSTEQTSHKPSTTAAQPLSLFAFLPSKVSPQCLGNVCRSHAQRHTVHLLLLHADLVVFTLWNRGTLWLIQTRAKNRQHPSSPATLLIETSAINKHTINTDFVNHTANSIAQTRAYQLKKTVSVPHTI